MISTGSKDPNSKCKYCGKILYGQNKSNCCIKCRHKEVAQKKFYEWLKTGELNLSVFSTLRGHLREMFLDYYGRKCSICSITEIWNEKHLVLILDHKDGNAMNNQKDNLRFVCPNCDSQLPTFKSRNTKSARKGR